jgi:hypothetical protein
MGFDAMIKPQINNDVFMRLLLRVYDAEQKNFKTQKRKPNEMNTYIRGIIEQEADKDAD